MSNYYDRFSRNIQRVNNLCEVFTLAKETHKRPTVKEADVLRAAVVFLHSALEDYLRGIIGDYLASNDTENLKNIALLGNDGRASKFMLGDLIPFSGYTVSQLIQESINEQLHVTSFNDTSDIAGWLKRINVQMPTSCDLSKLDTMIKRRHKIVHEVDSNQNTGRGNHNATSINLITVKSWVENVISFVWSIEQQLPC